MSVFIDYKTRTKHKVDLTKKTRRVTDLQLSAGYGEFGGMYGALGEADVELDAAPLGVCGVICSALHAADDPEVTRLRAEAPNGLWIYLSPELQQLQLVSVSCRDQLGGRSRELDLAAIAVAGNGCWCITDLPAIPQRFTIQLDGFTEAGSVSAVIFVDPNTANVAFVSSEHVPFRFAGFITQILQHQPEIVDVIHHTIVCLLFFIGNHPNQVSPCPLCNQSSQ